ncbi:MAG: adenylate/guanylate cyclase [uncultured bacterium]|nr:MAG: adenylate/guanylate cyclase [uncultured bacterium]
MYPAHLMEHICEYFDELSKIIVAEKGTIDKYIGDSIMAFWGAPLSEKNPVHHAAHAALKCFKRLEELNSRWKAEGKPQFITRMGLHVGEAIVGNLGSSERLNYTAIGAAVNTANRLEGINKIYGSSIMVSEAVYKAIKNHFVLRLLDCIRVKGKHKSSFIYELLAVEASHLSFDIHAYRFAFSKGFAAYQRERWDEAINVFNQCLVIYPEDKTALLFIQRCERFKQHPPAKDWDGVWQVSEK